MFIASAARSAAVSWMGCNARCSHVITEPLSAPTLVYSDCSRKGIVCSLLNACVSSVPCNGCAREKAFFEVVLATLPYSASQRIFLAILSSDLLIHFLTYTLCNACQF